MTGPRLWFVNRFYWPEEPATAQLLTDLAVGLAAQGCQVTVITSHSGKPTLPRHEQQSGVVIHRLGGGRWGQRHLAGKAIDFLCFHFGAGWHAWRNVRRNDVVIAMTDPPLLGITLWMSAALRGARLIHWCQDIYPEVAMALTQRPVLRWLVGLWRGPRNFTWRHSAGCIAVGNDLAALVIREGMPSDKVTVIPNWAPAGIAPPSPETIQAQQKKWEVEGKFVVAYSGNLGRVHDLDPILGVATALRDLPKIVFLFVGHGAQRESLESRALAAGLTNVRFLPPQPRADLAVSLAAGDLHLVTLRAGCESTVFPSKLYGIAAVGRPVLFIGPSTCELAELVRSRGLGFTFQREEISAIAACLRHLAECPAELTAARESVRLWGDTTAGSGKAIATWQRFLERLPSVASTHT